MARVTIEDCLKKVDNSFELVLLASAYAKTVSGSLFDSNKHKSHVVALREIADGNVEPSELKKKLVALLSNKNANEDDDFEGEEENSKEMKDAVDNLELLASESVSLD